MIGVISAQIFNFAFVKWELVILILLLLAAVFIAHRKGIKVALGFLVVPVLLIAEELLVKYLVYLGFQSPSDAIRIAIAWGPTVMFVLAVLYGVLFGLWRGFRKSAIFMLHAVCAGVVCISLFFLFTRATFFDSALLQFVNQCMGGDGALQQLLGVEAECQTVKQVLTEWIPAQFGYGSDIYMILADNGAYLATLVDMAYNIVFGLLCYLLYLFIDFLLYIIYHIAYSERKYKRRKKQMFAQNKTDSNYRKHTLAGGLVGLGRGLVVGLISLSFLGSAFYVVAGGTGNGELKSYSFGDDNIDLGYEIYRSVEDYGAHGIFKILNAMQDTDQSPYYLFAADLIFSGRVDDDVNDVHANIKFRKELAAYTGFARQTMALLLDYGGDKLIPILEGKTDENAMNAVISVMSEPQFQAAFTDLIDSFESQTYIINFGLAMVDSVVSHIDELSFTSSLSESNRDLIQLLFKSGYLSKTIPDERAMLDAGKRGEQPYINLSKILQKSDVKVLYRMMTKLLTSDFSQTEDVIDTVTELLPDIEQLSILSSARKDEFDPVLGRLYCYVANVYLSGAESEGVTYREIAEKKVAWIDEIRDLLTVADNGIALYKEAMSVEGDTMTKLLSIFDETRENYQANMQRFDATCEVIADSKLIGCVLSTDLLHDMLATAFTAVSENMYVPESVMYENQYAADQTIVQYGELYRCLYGLRALCTGENRDILDSVLAGSSDMQLGDILELLSHATTDTDDQGNTLADYMIESVYIRSLITALLTDYAGDYLYVPDSVKAQNGAGETVNLIEQVPLRQLLTAFADPDITDVIRSVVDGTASAGVLLKNEALMDLLLMKNGILEGTVAKFLIGGLSENKMIVLPRALSDKENLSGWISENGTTGELYRIVNALRKSELDLDAIINGGDTDTLLDQILGIPADAVNAIFDSDILYYTVSDFVLSPDMQFGDFVLIVPNYVKRIVSDDTVDTLVAKNELSAIFEQIIDLRITADSTTTDILKALLTHKSVVKDSMIISASAAYTVATSTDMQEMVSIPDSYVAAANEKEKLFDYDRSHIWYNELICLLDALDALLDVDAEDFTLDADELTAAIKEKISTLNEVDPQTGKSNLQICCSSDIVRYNLTEQLDPVIEGLKLNERVLAAAKDDYGFTYRELEALVNATTVLELDGLLDLKGEEIAAKAKDGFLNLNMPRDDFDGKTGLEVIYPSVIVSSILSKELDKIFTESIIDVANVRDSRVIKYESGLYTHEELANCIAAANDLDIDTDSFTTDSLNMFDSLSKLRDKLDSVYRSYLVAGVITKSIHSVTQDEGSPLVDHRNAYMEDIAVYRIDEVRALTEILGDNTVDRFTLSDLSVLQNHVYDPATGNPKSYLINASLTKQLFALNDLIIPYKVINTKTNLIAAKELADLLRAFMALNGGDISDWKPQELALPPLDTAEIILESTIIRTLLTDKIIDATKGTAGSGNLYLAYDSITIDSAAIQSNGTIQATVTPANSVNADQLRIMLQILNTGDSPSYSLPRYNEMRDVYTIKEEDLPTYLQCDIIRYQIAKLLIDSSGGSELPTQVEQVYNISSGFTDAVDTLTADDIIDYMNRIKG